MITEILLDVTVTCDRCIATAPAKLPMMLLDSGGLVAGPCDIVLPDGWSTSGGDGDLRGTNPHHYCPTHAFKPPLTPVRVKLDFVMMCEDGIPHVDPLDLICDGAAKAGAKEILPGARVDMRRPAPAWLSKKTAKPAKKTRSTR